MATQSQSTQPKSRRKPFKLVTDDQILKAWEHGAEPHAAAIARLVGLNIHEVRVRLDILNLAYVDPEKPAKNIQQHRMMVDISSRFRLGESIPAIARALHITNDRVRHTVYRMGLRVPGPCSPRLDVDVITTVKLASLPPIPTNCLAPEPPPTELTNHQIRAACRTHDDLRSAALALQVIPSVLRRRVNAQKAVRPKLREDYEHWDIDRPILKFWSAGTDLDQMAKQLRHSRAFVSQVVKQLRLPKRKTEG